MRRIMYVECGIVETGKTLESKRISLNMYLFSIPKINHQDKCFSSIFIVWDHCTILVPIISVVKIGLN